MFRNICYRVAPAGAMKTSSIRMISSSAPRLFLGNLFGSREAKKHEELIEKQDDYTVDADSKIVILDETNSPNHKPFDAEADMPGFEVKNWKFTKVQQKDIETTYDIDSVNSTLITTYNELANASEQVSDLGSIKLNDLNFRFKYSKLLQQNLGFDISDYVFSTSHDLQTLSDNLNQIINTRYVNERNPNGIVLRDEDFTAPNVYLNNELSDFEKEKFYEEILAKAKEA